MRVPAFKSVLKSVRAVPKAELEQSAITRRLLRLIDRYIKRPAGAKFLRTMPAKPPPIASRWMPGRRAIPKLSAWFPAYLDEIQKIAQGTFTAIKDPGQIARVQQQMRQMQTPRATYKPQAGLKYWQGLRAGGSKEIGMMPPKAVMPKAPSMPTSVAAGDVLAKMRTGKL